MESLESRFDDYYRPFLGVDDDRLAAGEAVFGCEQRSIPCLRCNHSPALATMRGDRLVVSTEPRFADGLRAHLDGRGHTALTDGLIADLDDFLFGKVPFTWSRRMVRLSVDRETLVSPASIDRAVVLGPEHRDLILGKFGTRGPRFLELAWQDYEPHVRAGRYLGVLDGDALVSYCHVSDIDFRGANLAVGTDPSHRRRGLAGAVVARAVRWCFEHDVLPIYWAMAANLPSIALAQSLGFRQLATEIEVRFFRLDVPATET